MTGCITLCHEKSFLIRTLRFLKVVFLRPVFSKSLSFYLRGSLFFRRDSGRVRRTDHGITVLIFGERLHWPPVASCLRMNFMEIQGASGSYKKKGNSWKFQYWCSTLVVADVDIKIMFRFEISYIWKFLISVLKTFKMRTATFSM